MSLVHLGGSGSLCESATKATEQQPVKLGRQPVSGLVGHVWAASACSVSFAIMFLTEV